MHIRGQVVDIESCDGLCGEQVLSYLLLVPEHRVKNVKAMLHRCVPWDRQVAAAVRRHQVAARHLTVSRRPAVQHISVAADSRCLHGGSRLPPKPIGAHYAVMLMCCQAHRLSVCIEASPYGDALAWLHQAHSSLVQRRDGQVSCLHLPHLRGLKPHVRPPRLAVLQHNSRIDGKGSRRQRQQQRQQGKWQQGSKQ